MELCDGNPRKLMHMCRCILSCKVKCVSYSRPSQKSLKIFFLQYVQFKVSDNILFVLVSLQLVPCLPHKSLIDVWDQKVGSERWGKKEKGGRERRKVGDGKGQGDKWRGEEEREERKKVGLVLALEKKTTQVSDHCGVEIIRIKALFKINVNDKNTFVTSHLFFVTLETLQLRISIGFYENNRKLQIMPHTKMIHFHPATNSRKCL